MSDDHAERGQIPPDDPGTPVDDPPYYRPAGHVETDPVIRRIGDRDLFIGNAAAADPDEHDYRFDHVLSATESSHPMTTHHCPMVDADDIEWERFAAGADTARELYRAPGTTLIHCKGGISRSTTLLAVAIAAEEGRHFRDAMGEVVDARPLATPRPRLHHIGVEYLAARGLP